MYLKAFLKGLEETRGLAGSFKEFNSRNVIDTRGKLDSKIFYHETLRKPWKGRGEFNPK